MECFLTFITGVSHPTQYQTSDYVAENWNVNLQPIEEQNKIQFQ